MIAVLSPAKKLDFESSPVEVRTTVPALAKDTRELLETTRQLTAKDLAQLMKLSGQLAKLNYERFQVLTPPAPKQANAKAAALAFMGDTYQGLRAWEFDADDLEFAQTHVRILSGLYGVLRPLDAIQPYRLEMGTRLSTGRGKSLYEFWGDKIAQRLTQEASEQEHGVIVNLASNEYFTAAQTKKLNVPVLTCVFKEVHGNSAKVVGFSAKRARGMMARFIVKQRLTEPGGLKDFNDAGYRYDAKNSTAEQLIFARKHS